MAGRGDQAAGVVGELAPGEFEQRVNGRPPLDSRPGPAYRRRSSMEWELRMYTVKPGKLDAFAEEWREHVVPLRRRFGFEILGAWTVPEHNQFVWVVGYAGESTFDAQVEAYYGSEERKALPADPARHLDVIDTRRMSEVPFPAG
jgi:hypothetical protein